MEPIIIWGAGAIGGTIGAHLARAGRSVRFVDVDQSHVSAMNRTGLRITGPVAAFHVPAQACAPQELEGRYRWILLAVKAHHTAAAIDALVPHLDPEGAVVSLQNGLCETLIAEQVGTERTIGAFINFGADYQQPGEIEFGNRGAVVVGELDGTRSSRILALHDLLRLFESDAIIAEDILAFLWGKVGYGGLLKASALTNMTMAEYLDAPDLRALHVALVQELLAVACAEGVKPIGVNGFDPEAFSQGDALAIDRSLAAMADFNRASAKQRSGIWRDLAVRKRRTDCAAQLAPVRAAARRHGLETPLTDRMLALIAQVEDGKSVQGPGLIERLVDALTPSDD